MTSQNFRFPICEFATTLAVSLVMIAASALAQDQSPQSPLAEGVDNMTAQEAMPGAMYFGAAQGDINCCGELTCWETIRESLVGDASAPGKWRPLTLDTFFSEGWHEPWAGGPAGQCGLTPRHGWLGAFEGVFYRLWLVNTTYQHDLNKSFGGDGYGANFTTFLPFSRRFEMYINAPFVSANGTDDPNQGYRSDFGDISIAGSFLLSESAGFTQLVTVGATAPTGRTATGGHLTAVNPRYSFWSNPGGGPWVVRGGAGINVSLDTSVAPTTGQASLAIGRYFTPHDVPFGDLVFYANCATIIPFEGGNGAQVGVGPGTRFQITGDWYFLHYWEFQVGANQPYDYQIQTAVVKAW